MAQAGQGATEKGAVEQVADAVGDVATKAQETAVQLKDEGSDRVRHLFDERSTQAGEQIRSLASALREGKQQLAQQGKSGSQLTGQVAERLDRFGTYLEKTTSDDVIRDAEAFARRRPWILAGLGTLAGLAAARFVKASSEGRHRSDGRTRNGQSDHSSSSPAARASSQHYPAVTGVGQTAERTQLTGTR